MPSKNILKMDAFETYYHVYARGTNKQPIFLDDDDRTFFISLYKRYLSDKPVKNKLGEVYPNYFTTIKLVTYCLMENHFHLLVYQVEKRAMSSFMRSLLTSYSRYFNYKYKRTGSLFESRYKAKDIDSQTYLDHISRYIHMNPRYWFRYQYSSLKYYANRATTPIWLDVSHVMDMFKNPDEYIKFLKSYEGRRRELKEVKQFLADK